ncbi:restriction endonuclease subunit S [Burkholderia pseudomallei]|uniref:restriction endonuclease subunit S n=1 Tax=Burkholderia pseudomallei TaxID=28450 RepID=UPI0022D17C01|nr:restriction endonuclease subunit S [Burkholderia pseudomallei]MDA0558324.1 restriction endonuclease subunit S [Burkholderia pseudomallei]
MQILRASDIENGRLLTSNLLRVSQDIEAAYARSRLHGGEVLLTLVGAYFGKVAVARKEHAGMNTARAVGVLPVTEDAHYVAYALMSPKCQAFMRERATTTAQPTLNLRDVGRIPIPWPCASARRQITNALQVLDARIDLLRETNTTLESIAQVLFKSWFIDFDPVRARAEGREPEGMSAETAALFPREFEESRLGLIPEGWRLSELGSLVDLTKGCSYKGEGLSDDEGAYMFNLGCFNAHRVFATEKVKRYTGEYKPRHAVVAGDLIIANTDMTQARDILGRPVFVPDGFEPGFVSHHVFKVTVKRSELPVAEAIRLFLFYSLQQTSFRERAIGYATGTTVLALPATAVAGCPAVLPPDPVLLKFAEFVRPLLVRIRQNEKQSASLAEVRDSLLPRLISGKLRVPEAVQQVEEAFA